MRQVLKDWIFTATREAFHLGASDVAIVYMIHG